MGRRTGWWGRSRRPRTWALPSVLGVVALAVAGFPVPTSPAGAADMVPVAVPADAETEPAPSTGDAMDDPAIWHNAADPAASILIGNDKQGGLDVYGMDGVRRQRITTGTAFWGNVDVRQGVTLGEGSLDLVAAYNAGLRFFTVDTASLQLAPATDDTGVVPTDGGEGLCLHHGATLSAFVITIGGRVRQYTVTDADADGLVEASLVRELHVGSEAEGCVADDATGALYVSEEDVGLWRYETDPASGSTRTLVDSVQPAGRIAADAEGVTIVETAPGEGHVVVSAQNVAAPSESYFVAYGRTTGEHTGSFRVVDGAQADGCSRTDGITALARDLGPGFPSGAFVCQDDANTAPGSAGNQNFKLVRLERVLDALSAPSEPPPSGDVAFVGAASSNGNRTVHRTPVHASVLPGDTLLAFFGANGTSTVTGPAGWDLVGTVDDGVAGRVWTRTATAGDAGALVTVTTAAYQRSDLSIVAYRGTDPAQPLTVAGHVEVRAGGPHTTPTVVAPVPGLVVSYWAERSADGTSLTLPPEVVERASSSGTGGGKITAAVGDPGAVTGPGTVGGVTATGSSSWTRTVAFTVVVPASSDEEPPPPPPPPTGDVTFVGAESTNGNRLQHRATIPAGVGPGDRLLLFFGANGASTVTGPSGWTLLGSVGDNGAVGRVWTRHATASDAGAEVTVTTAAHQKSDLSVVAYRVGTEPVVPQLAGSLQVAGGAAHVTPVLDASAPGLVVSYWAEKSASSTSLALPPDQVLRTSSSGSGGGRITAALSDPGAVAGPGAVGGVTATGADAPSRTAMFTVVVPAPS